MERERGLAVLGQVRDMCLQGRFPQFSRAAVDVYTAKGAGQVRRPRQWPYLSYALVIADMFHADIAQMYGILATGFLVGDTARSPRRVTRRKPRPRSSGWRPRQPMRVLSDTRHLAAAGYALLAEAHGDEAAYRDYRDRYRDMATSLGFEGHMKWAEAMP